MRFPAALLAALLHAVPASAAASEDLALPRDSVYQLSAEFRDQRGRPVAWRDLRGKPRIVTMFYASCPYVCPMIVDSLRSVERTLTPAERGRIGYVLISMDPEHDTPEALAALMSKRRIDTPAWTALQPRPGDIRRLAGLLGIRYRPLDDGEINHTTMLVLLDAEGRIVATTERIGAAGDPDFLASVRAALRTR